MGRAAAGVSHPAATRLAPSSSVRKRTSLPIPVHLFFHLHPFTSAFHPSVLCLPPSPPPSLHRTLRLSYRLGKLPPRP